MARVLNVAILALALVAAPLWLAYADEDREQEIWRERFSQFAGIAYLCTTNPESEYEQDLCDAITADVRFLSASSKVKVEVATEPFNQAFLARNNEYVSLTVSIMAAGGIHFYGAHVRIEASRYYRGAKEAEPIITIDRVPRSGDLVLWSNQMLATGAQDHDLKSAVTSSVGKELRIFFTNYIQAQSN